jgi:hypothetical protein
MALRPLIDRGRFRVPCASCDGEIPRGHARYAEVINDGRVPNAKYQYHHFECAVVRDPKAIRELLVTEAYDEGLIPDARSLKAELHDRSEAREAGKPVPPRRIQIDTEPRVEELMQQLFDDPTDRDTLGVLADVLTERGDPRGELIILDLALGDDEGTEEQEDRRRELRHRLLPRICTRPELRTQTFWRLGFIERAAVGTWYEIHDNPFRDPWSHFSLRLLQDLAIGSNASDWLVSPMPALRRLAVASGKLDKLPSLPRLEELRLDSAIERAGIDALAAMLDGRRLARIIVPQERTGTETRERLAMLCDQLVLRGETERYRV